MAEKALPCIVCGRELDNVFSESENQPNNGLAFSSHGHYGSTVFDPMDGTYLEITVCDRCLTKAGEQGRVLSGRDRRPVVFDRMGQIGWERINRPAVPWTKDLAGYDEKDVCWIDHDDLDSLPSTISLNFPPQQIRDYFDHLESEGKDYTKYLKQASLRVVDDE